MLKKLLALLSDAMIYGASSLLGQFIGMLLLPIYTAYISPEANGAYLMITNVVAFLGPLANLGMINAVFRRFNLEKQAEQRGEVLSTGLCSIGLATASVLLAGFVFVHSIARIAVGADVAASDARIVPFVQLALLTIAANCVGAVPLAVLRADRRVKTTALVNIFRILLTISVTIYLVVVQEAGVRGLFLGSLVGEVATTLLLLAVTARAFRYAPTWKTWKRMASYGMPYVPHQVQGRLVEMIPPYAVGMLVGLGDAALYGIALKFALPIAFVVNSVHNAWVPYKFQIHAEDEDSASFFRTAVTYYVAGILYLWVGVSLWGPEMVWLLTAESYHSAALLVPFVGLIPVSQGIYFMMGTGIELSDDTRPIPLVTLAGLIVVAIAVPVFIPFFGAAGGALAAVSSFVALTVVLYYLSQQRFPIRYDWATLIPLLVLALASVIVGYWGLGLPAWPRLSLSVVISLAFPLIEFAILARSPTERHRMRILASKLRRGKDRASVAVASEVPEAVSPN